MSVPPAAAYIKKPKQEQMSMSKARWNLLASILLPSKQAMGAPSVNQELLSENATAFRYPSYKLLRIETERVTEAGAEDEGDRCWHSITADDIPQLRLKISTIRPFFNKSNLSGFNNTGNVCIWPAEECLAVVCLENPHLISAKSVIELGSGMTGLAGLVAHQVCQPRSLLLTDGNAASVANLNVLLQENKLDQQVRAQQLVWDAVGPELEGIFDVVMCSDCIFFTEFRQDLCDCIWKLLRPEGRAILLAPRRGTSIDEFEKICAEKFRIRISENYSKRISRRRLELLEEEQFKEDKHYPILIEMKKLKVGDNRLTSKI